MSAAASTAGGPGDEFILPDVGEGLDQAEIVEWLVTAGDAVERDQPLVEVLTDKSQTQLPSPKAGIIKTLRFAEGDIAEVGQVLVEFESSGSPTAETEPSKEPALRRPKASPVVRRRALGSGIDLETVDGTGPGGRITVEDLDRMSSRGHVGSISPVAPTIEPPPPLPSTVPGDSLGQLPTGRHPLRGIRRVTAEGMNTSWTIPHIHGADEFDATNLLTGRKRIKTLQPEQANGLTPMAFFVMAVANALRRFPILNASITVGTGSEPGHIDVHDRVNIGIAVATDAGLLVPVIQNADQMSLFEIATEIARLSGAGRSRTITNEDLRNGTCTITNYGSLGGRYASPIIRSPEAAIVGFGSIRQRPIVVDGQVVARPTLPIAVACDHRLIDGDVMTAFQEHVIQLLTDPVALLAR